MIVLFRYRKAWLTRYLKYRYHWGGSFLGALLWATTATYQRGENGP